MSVKQVILTPFLFKLLQLQIQVGSMFRGTPFTWTSSELFPRVDKSPWNIFKYKINSMVLQIFVIFECIRAYQGYFEENGSSLGKFYGLWVAFIYVANVPFQFLLLFRRIEFILSAQQVMLLVWEFQEERGYVFHAEKKSGRNLAVIILVFFGGVGFNGCAGIILAFFLPHNPVSPTSILYNFTRGQLNGDDFWLVFPIRLLNASLNAYVVYTTAATLLAVGSMLICFFVLPTAILHEIRLSKLEAPKSFEEMDRHLKIFERIMIIVKHFSNICGLLFGWMQWAATLLAVFCFYVAVSFGGVIAVILGGVGLSCCAMFVIIFSKAAKVGEESRLLIEAWKCGGQKRPLLIQQKIRVLRPLWIQMDHMYYFDNHFVLRACSIIVELTVNALLVV